VLFSHLTVYSAAFFLLSCTIAFILFCCVQIAILQPEEDDLPVMSQVSQNVHFFCVSPFSVFLFHFIFLTPPFFLKKVLRFKGAQSKNFYLKIMFSKTFQWFIES